MTDLETNDTVFVYGTLKKGYGNSRIFTRHEAEYLGSKVTKDAYVLGDIGFPYLFSHSATEGLDEVLFKPVVGDLWRVPNSMCLASLDSLEGVPSHYERHLIKLEGDIEAWTYMQMDSRALSRCLYCNVTDDNQWIWRD